MSITFHGLQDLDVIPAERRFNHYITTLVGSADYFLMHLRSMQSGERANIPLL